jgi:hypothetical protein
MKLAVTPLYESLSVVRLGKTDWRVSDASQPDRLLGFIEFQRPGRFEVTWMSDPVRWGYTDSFDEALVGFADSSRFIGEVFPERAATVVGTAPGRPVHRSTWLKRGRATSAA